MAFSSTTQWDVRTTGSNSNGGGFDTAASGTDYSQQDSPQFTYTDLVIDATTNTKITSSAHPFDSHSPGNIINVTGGTGFTVQRIQIVSVSGAVATCDKAVGTTSSTGGTGNLGGAVATIATANGVAVSGNTINIKSGTYSISSTLTLSVTNLSLVGFASNHNDGGTKPLITTATNSLDLIQLASGASGGETLLQNISFSNTAATRSSCITSTAPISSGALVVINCLFDGFSQTSQAAINADNVGSHFRINNIGVRGTEIKNCYYGISTNNTSLVVLGCYIHDNTSDGVHDAGANLGGVHIRSVYASNGGKGLNYNTSSALTVDSCCFYANVDGIYVLAGNLLWNSNNIFWGQSGYGINTVSGSSVNDDRCAASYGNAFGSNTSGNRNGYPAFPADITITAIPWVAAGSGNFTLNSTAGGGALLTKAGYPGVFPSGTCIGYVDVGSIQTTGGPGTVPASFGFIS